MNEQNTKIARIQKSSNIAMIFSRIAKILCIVFAVMLFLSSLLFLGLRNILEGEFAAAIESGAISADDFSFAFFGLSFSPSTLTGQSLVIRLIVYLFFLGIIMSCLAVLFHFVSKVFREIKESYSPFQPSVIKNLKIAFILIVILSLQSSLLIGAVIGFSLWCTLHIFEYGCELQKQSDEIL